MNIKYYNCPDPKPHDNNLLPEPPAFISYQPNFERIASVVQKYEQYKNIIVVGHGGSITSSAGFAAALIEKTSYSGKRFIAVSTIDPDYLARVKLQYSKENSVVVAISKSGETVTQIEALTQFLDYPMICITGDSGPLAAIAKQVGAETVPHPVIGGRYTGLTEVGLLPAALLGLNVQAIFEGGSAVYKNYAEENNAWQAASIMHELETKQGIVDVFVPFYDSALFGISNLIVQLCHESFGKDGKGQTYFGHDAPESQHHTNQRFFGGRKNIAGWFTSVEHALQDTRTQIPDDLEGIKLKSGTLQDLDHIPLHTALQFECEATIEDAHISGIPVVHQAILRRDEANIGALIAFWQLYAVYSSVLRQVDPFDQPQVENSKKISFAKRLQYKV